MIKGMINIIEYTISSELSADNHVQKKSTFSVISVTVIKIEFDLLFKVQSCSYIIKAIPPKDIPQTARIIPAKTMQI